MPKRLINHEQDKSTSSSKDTEREKPLDLFGTKEESIKDDQDEVEDSSDSDESYYSGLDDEESTDDSDLKDESLDEKEDSYDSEEEEDDDDDNDDHEMPDRDEKVTDKKSKLKPTDNNNGSEETRNHDNKTIKVTAKIDDGDETSDEEDARNTIGNIPVEWYNDYPHIGYNLDGKKILKPATADELDEFLSKMDNPNYWRTVKEKQTMKEVVLTDEELAIINRIQNSQFPEAGYDPYEPYVDFFTGEKMLHPVTNAPEPKQRFIPSKWEHQRVMKIVRAIRNGWIKPKQSKDDKPRFYLLWDSNEDPGRRRRTVHIPAPKMKLPGHDESYNPPPEYLPTEEEIAKWEELDQEDRPRNFLPKKYSNLRLVPAYNKFIQERFERCLDLYLCPRQRKMRVQINPNDLLPKLPRPKDLQPFPTTESIVYSGHEGMIRCVSVDPTGQWLASGSDDKTIRLWEVCTGRCLRTIQMEEAVNSLAWNPNSQCTLIVAAVSDQAVIINHGLGDKLLSSATDELIESFTPLEDGKEQPVEWGMAGLDEFQTGVRLIIKHSKAISQITWHSKGDYFATVLPQGGNKSVFIHQLSKRRSQCPFTKAKGLVQKVAFHPNKPFFFVATQKYVRVYNLIKQELAKKLVSNVRWISSIAVHPLGDNVIVGSYDKRLCWFDMDLSTKPYKTLRSHKKALRQVTFHNHYPLFASASDDGTVIICHGMVYNDLMQNPLLVPVKILKGHKVTSDLGVLDCIFHPSEPWIFTAGADRTIRLFT